MIAADVVRAGVFCALPFANSLAVVIALAAVAGFATGFFRPATYAALPNLVDDDDLPAGNALLQGVENVTFAAGPVLGGVIVSVASVDAAYWINAATFLVSAALIAGIPQRALQATASISKGHWRDLADGLAAVRRSRALQTVVVSWGIVMLGTALINVAEVYLATDAFDAGAFGYGLIFGSIGLGLVVGSFGAGLVVGTIRMAVLYAGSIAVMAIGFGVAAGAPNVWVAAPFCAVAGIGNGAALVCNALLVQRGAPDDLRGRVFSVVMSATYIVLGIGMAIAGPVKDALGPRAAWGIAAGILGVATIVGWALAARIRDERLEFAPMPLEPESERAAV